MGWLQSPYSGAAPIFELLAAGQNWIQDWKLGGEGCPRKENDQDGNAGKDLHENENIKVENKGKMEVKVKVTGKERLPLWRPNKMPAPMFWGCCKSVKGKSAFSCILSPTVICESCEHGLFCAFCAVNTAIGKSFPRVRSKMVGKLENSNNWQWSGLQIVGVKKL